MKLRTVMLLFCSMALCAPAFAQDCPEVPPEQMMATQQKMMALMGPGPEHALLDKMAGSWNATAKMWMIPGSPPMESPLTSQAELILDGRFLQVVSEGTMMGMETESISMIGFDRRHELYTMIGFDTMGTYYITAEGTYDEATKTLKFSGTDDDPTAGTTQVYDFIFEFKDDGSYTVTLIFHCPNFGSDGPFKMMEMEYTKADE